MCLIEFAVGYGLECTQIHPKTCLPPPKFSFENHQYPRYCNDYCLKLKYFLALDSNCNPGQIF